MELSLGLGLNENAQHGSHWNQNAFVKALADKLTVGTTPATILAQGDSTGVQTARWVYQMADWLKDKYPLYTKKYVAWNDANQLYDYPIKLATGTNGDGYGIFSGTIGNFFSAPYNSAINITGDIDLIGKVASANYDASTTQVIINKFGVGGNRGWMFAIYGRKIQYYWSPDGTTLLNQFSTIDFSANNNDAIWVRVTHDVDNAAGGNTVTFYTSSNGTTWAQLGDAIINVGVVNVFNSISTLDIGARGMNVGVFNGKIYQAIVKKGIGGIVVANPDFGQAFPSTVNSFSDLYGNVFSKVGEVLVGNGSPDFITLNAATSGAAMAYSQDVTRFAKQTPLLSDLSFINYGHNEGTNVDYTAQYESFCSQILAKFPLTGIVCTAQNPQIPPATYYTYHAIRCAQIIALAKTNGYGLINVYDAFVATGNVPALMADTAHPNADGYVIWLNLVKQFLNQL